VPLNVREGLGSLKGNRAARLHDAMGSAREVAACLEVAEALGYVRRDDYAEGVALLDEVCAMAWTLAYRPRR
jgi:four helix bundle protein